MSGILPACEAPFLERLAGDSPVELSKI